MTTLNVASLDGSATQAISSNNGGAYVVFGKSGGAIVDLGSIVTGTSRLGFEILGEATEDNADYGLYRAGDVNAMAEQIS